MLEWARTKANFDVAAAALKLGITGERLVEWERGESRPTIPQLRKAAKLYKRPLAAFYLPEPPRDFTLPNDYRRLPDAESGDYSPALLVAMRLADYRRSIALELDPQPATPEFVGTATTDQSADTLAERARAILGFSLEEQFSWRDEYKSLNAWKNALEGQGVLVFHFTGVEVGEVRGFSYGETPYPVIAVNGHDSVNGRIFTLAHECAHLLLGQDASCDLGNYTRPLGETDQVEVYCNAFAGNLLVPRDALLAEPAVSGADQRSEWSDSQLEAWARKFGVSREVILRRLLSLGKADQAFYESRRRDLLAVPFRPEDEEGGTGGPGFARMVVRDVGKPFARMVLDAYRADAITGSDVADYLGARLKHLPKIESYLTGPDLLTGGLR